MGFRFAYLHQTLASFNDQGHGLGTNTKWTSGTVNYGLRSIRCRYYVKQPNKKVQSRRRHAAKCRNANSCELYFCSSHVFLFIYRFIAILAMFLVVCFFGSNIRYSVVIHRSNSFEITSLLHVVQILVFLHASIYRMQSGLWMQIYNRYEVWFINVCTSQDRCIWVKCATSSLICRDAGICVLQPTVT